MKVKIKEREIDLTPVLPLKVGDWRALAKLGAGVSKFEDLGNSDSDTRVEVSSVLTDYLLQKAGITDLKADDLDLEDLLEFVRAAGSAESKEKPDRPT